MSHRPCQTQHKLLLAGRCWQWPSKIDGSFLCPRTQRCTYTYTHTTQPLQHPVSVLGLMLQNVKESTVAREGKKEFTGVARVWKWAQNVHRERGRGRESRQSTRGKARDPGGPMACAEDKGATGGTERRAIPESHGWRVGMEMELEPESRGLWVAI